jgi:hypothetical protein
MSGALAYKIERLLSWKKLAQLVVYHYDLTTPTVASADLKLMIMKQGQPIALRMILLLKRCDQWHGKPAVQKRK